MFDNCRAYNGTGLYVKTADALERHVKKECHRLDRPRARVRLLRARVASRARAGAREDAGLPRIDCGPPAPPAVPPTPPGAKS